MFIRFLLLCCCCCCDEVVVLLLLCCCCCVVVVVVVLLCCCCCCVIAMLVLFLLLCCCCRSSRSCCVPSFSPPHPLAVDAYNTPSPYQPFRTLQVRVWMYNPKIFPYPPPSPSSRPKIIFSRSVLVMLLLMLGIRC